MKIFISLTKFPKRLSVKMSSGQNVNFEYRFAGESAERARLAAAELVGSKPDLLFVTTNPALSALLRETRTIPIVFTWVSESVGSGYVSSLARPGGNVTGFHNFEPAVGGKWLGIRPDAQDTD